MHIKPHNTKFPFNWIMEVTFILSRFIKNKPNNNKFSGDSNKWPMSDAELAAFFVQWSYSFDPAHGLINMVAHPDIARFLLNGDCDDYAAKLYALCPLKEKYILTYFTHNLKKWHTVFVWYNEKTSNYNSINWSKRETSHDFDIILASLEQKGGSPWYDYHLASFDYFNNRWVTHK